MDTWIRRAKLHRVVDGDTIDMYIDLGYDCVIKERIRVLGVDAPEMKGEEREAGKLAKAYVETWFESHSDGSDWPFVVWSQKGDSFRRWLGRIYCNANCSLADSLLEMGYAVPYEG